jgi:hypothetical protein
MCDFQSTCDVCGEFRQQFLLQLTRHDVSDQVGLEAGSVERIVRHCCDRRECIEAAEDPELWQLPLPEDFDPWAASDGAHFGLLEADDERAIGEACDDVEVDEAESVIASDS